MQGILKSNHQKLCDCLQDVKAKQSVTDFKLNQLENELCSAFKNYQEMMTELKKVIINYEEKQRLIKNEIKRIRKFSVEASKKEEKYVLS